MNPRINIIVRSMDRPTLSRTLASIAAQGRDDVEAIVVAACGSRHRALDNNHGAIGVRLVRGEARLDRAAAGNTGLMAASADFVGFLDDDDEMLPGHLDAMLAALADQPQCALAFGRTVVRAQDGQVLGEMGEPADAFALLGAPPFHTNAALFRRALIESGARFDVGFEIGEDVDFWLQCAMRTGFAFVNRISTVWNAEAGTSGAGAGTNANSAKMARAAAQMHAKWLLPVFQSQTDWRGRFRLVHFALNHDRLDNAEAMLTQIAQAHPNDPNTLRLQAILAQRRGDAITALTYYERAIAAAPDVAALRAESDALRSQLSLAG